MNDIRRMTAHVFTRIAEGMLRPDEFATATRVRNRDIYRETMAAQQTHRVRSVARGVTAVLLALMLAAFMLIPPAGVYFWMVLGTALLVWAGVGLARWRQS